MQENENENENETKKETNKETKTKKTTKKTTKKNNKKKNGMFYGGCLSNLLLASVPYLAIMVMRPARAVPRGLRIAYNGFMACFSLVCAVLSLAEACAHDAFGTDAGAVLDPISERQATVLMIFFVSKYLEWFDTVVIVSKNPDKMSFLHTFHHFGAPVCTGLLYLSRAPFGWIFVGFNGIIHFFMYTYYLACIVLPENAVLRRFRIVMTSLQVAQFVIGMGHLRNAYEPIVCDAVGAGAGDGDMMCSTLYFCYAYVGTVLLLFLHFFQSNYLVARRPARTNVKRS